MASAFLGGAATALGTTEETLCHIGDGTEAAAVIARVDQARAPSLDAIPIADEHVASGSKVYAVARERQRAAATGRLRRRRR